MDNMSLSDIAAVTRGAEDFGGGGSMWFLAIILILLIAGGGAFGGGDYGRFATASSQQEILFGQQFQSLDNKMDRLGNGIADATFALNNTIVSEGRNTQDKIYAMDKDLSDKIAGIGSLIQQNKIESLQNEVNTLKTQNMFCGVPKISPYMYNIQPNCGCNCNCGNF